MAEEKLIETVKTFPELYDTKHSNYMKAKLKSRIWSDIAQGLKFKNGKFIYSNLKYY